MRTIWDITGAPCLGASISVVEPARSVGHFQYNSLVSSRVHPRSQQKLSLSSAANAVQGIGGNIPVHYILLHMVNSAVLPTRLQGFSGMQN